MPSPFPGMDPYLENPAHWPDFHNDYISAMRGMLNAMLKPNYFALSEERVFIASEEDGARRLLRPDTSIHPADERHEPLPSAGAVATEPIEAITSFEEEIREPFLVIYDSEGRRVVTMIEVLSPTNKTPGNPGFDDYRRKRREIKRSAAHLVEIDLLRAGQRVVNIPELRSADYNVHVSVATRRPRGWVWPILLPQRLPRVTIPLLEGDPDVVLDLQAAFDLVYDRSPYEAMIDYRGEPLPPLPPPYAEWADALLREKGLR